MPSAKFQAIINLQLKWQKLRASAITCHLSTFKSTLVIFSELTKTQFLFHIKYNLIIPTLTASIQGATSFYQESSDD